MAKAEEERKALDRRLADARKAAAGELGDIVISAGAHMLPPKDLKALLAAMISVGPARSLEILTAAAAKPAVKVVGVSGADGGEDAGRAAA